MSYSLLSGTASINDVGIRIRGTGAHVLDISTHSTAAATASVNIPSGRLTVSGGSFSLTDNLAGYTATLATSGLEFSSSCACPTSGSLSGAVTGAFNASVTMTFGGACGSVTVSSPTYGTNTAMTIASCALP